MQLVSNADLLLLCTMPSDDRRTVGKMLSTALSTIELEGRGIDVPTANAMLSMLASTFKESTCVDPCADSTSSTGRHLMDASNPSFDTTPSPVSQTTATSIANFLDDITNGLLLQTQPNSGYLSAGDGSQYFVSAAKYDGQAVENTNISVGPNMQLVGGGNVTLASSANSAKVSLRTQYEAPCPEDETESCTVDNMFDFAVQYTWTPQDFITKVWMATSAVR